MKSVDLDHARSALSHRIAASVHTMLAERGMTIDELKDKLAKFPSPQCNPDIVDAILTGADDDRIRVSDLSDIAWALGFEWDFKILRWPNEIAPASPSEFDSVTLPVGGGG